MQPYQSRYILQDTQYITYLTTGMCILLLLTKLLVLLQYCQIKDI